MTNLWTNLWPLLVAVWTLLLATAPVGLGTALLMALVHYLGWHQRQRWAAFPPINYTIGVCILFGGFYTWAASLDSAPPLVTVTGCLLITGWAGLADVLVWRWHPHQTHVEAQTTVQGLEGVLTHLKGRKQ